MEEFSDSFTSFYIKTSYHHISTKELQRGQWDLDKRQGGAAKQPVSHRERNCCLTCPLKSKPQEQQEQAKWIWQVHKPQLHAMYGPHGDIWSAQVLCWLQDTQPFTIIKPRGRDSTKQCPTPEKRKWGWVWTEAMKNNLPVYLNTRSPNNLPVHLITRRPKTSTCTYAPDTVERFSKSKKKTKWLEY